MFSLLIWRIWCKIAVQISEGTMAKQHISVLLEEVCEAFSGSTLHVFVDGTLGAGGHAEAILQAHPEIKQYVGIDQDPVAREIARERLLPWKDKVVIVPGNFAELEQHLIALHIGKIDGALFDLGVSSMQLDQPAKGFSFSREGPLDMRMNPEGELTAAQIVNEWSESDLARVIRNYGEEKQWRRAARAIVEARQKGPIETTTQLAAVLEAALFRTKKGLNPATLVFQGLRICVNSELEVVEKVVPLTIDRLAKGGRLAVISFHSLEDRIVKQSMQFAASDKWDTSGIGGVFLDKKPLVRIITRKPLVPTDNEVHANPRSRSAKLRVVEKI